MCESPLVKCLTAGSKRLSSHALHTVTAVAFLCSSIDSLYEDPAERVSAPSVHGSLCTAQGTLGCSERSQYRRVLWCEKSLALDFMMLLYLQPYSV